MKQEIKIAKLMDLIHNHSSLKKCLHCGKGTPNIRKLMAHLRKNHIRELSPIELEMVRYG